MSRQYAWSVNYNQTTGSVAAGLSNVPILVNSGAQALDHGYENAIFGVSVAGSSGNFGLNIIGVMPNGLTMVVAAQTGVGAVKLVFSPTVAFTGTTFNGLVPRPYEVVFHRAVGTSISYNALVWGILSNP